MSVFIHKSTLKGTTCDWYEGLFNPKRKTPQVWSPIALNCVQCNLNADHLDFRTV